MHKTITLLLQLQELAITMNEAKILHGEDTELDELREKEFALREQTDVDVLARYDRLSQHGLGLVRLQGGMCMGCNMSIPQGDLNRIKKSEQASTCPNCGRYLVIE